MREVLTTTYFDENKWTPIGLVTGMSIRAISVFRGIFSGFSSLTGGKMDAIEQKFIEAREEALKEMLENAKANGATRIIAVDIDVSELSRGDTNAFIVFTATGTALKPHTNRKNNAQNGGRKSKKLIKKSRTKKRASKKK